MDKREREIPNFEDHTKQNGLLNIISTILFKGLESVDIETDVRRTEEREREREREPLDERVNV